MALRFDSDAEPIPGYRLVDRLGSGGFGEVWKCVAPGGINKAIKIIHGDLRSKDNDLVRYAEQELKALKRVKTVRHPYLLALDRYDIVEGRLLIVMELADCNLWDRFRQCRMKGQPGIPRDELLLYMAEAAEVLDLMNVEHQLLHLDVKPQNIFLQYNHVKVGDFGQVKDLEGVVASVTGGITPVYAAPETFDGVVTRFCDQYSLACVYQELLTGQRPFDGMSMQQLLMQHLAAPPNLQPSPPSDRPALDRALAKNPDHRWPGCRAFVEALRKGGELPTASVGRPAVAAATPPADRPGLAAPLLGVGSRLGPAPPDDTPPVAVAPADEESALLLRPADPSPPVAAKRLTESDLADNTPPPAADLEPAVAPPESAGPGPVRPAVIVGVGQAGLRVLQRLRKQLTDRFGPPDRLPAVRLLFIDTDPDTLAAAAADRPADGLAGLHPDEIVPARLNRSAHYLKPRLNGRTLTEGWFDPQLLNRLPRNPVTMGLRPLGRLALCDHYRTISQRLGAELETCLLPEALADTVAATGLEARTNRPRVYVVAGVAGGTGGGMFLDLAYLARARLRRLGYADPDVVGMLFVPADDAGDEAPPQARANAYAALTELHHFACPETMFRAHYDDRAGYTRDPGPPFAEVLLMAAPAAVTLTPAAGPGGSSARIGGVWRAGSSGVQRASVVRSGILGSPGTRGAVAPAVCPDAAAAAADLLRLELFGPVGRAADDARPAADRPAEVTARAIGLTRHGWPRYEVLDRTARVLAGVVVDHWVTPDFGRARGRVPEWVAAKFADLGLAGDALPAALRRAADLATGAPVDAVLVQATDPLVPKGWLARVPEPGHLLMAVDHVARLVGGPGGRGTAAAEEAVRAAAVELADAAGDALTEACHGLIDDPAFRLAGAEEAVHQILADAEAARARATADSDRAEAEARAGYELLMASAHPTRTGRRPSTAEVGEALRAYPAAQYRAAVHRHAALVWERVKGTAAALQAELTAARGRLAGLQREVVADVEAATSGVGPRDLLPAGCSSVEEAAQRFLGVLTDDDLHQAEGWVQAGIERRLGGLYQALLNSADGHGGLLLALREETRRYLDARLGEVDLAGMFDQRYGPGVGRVLAQAWADAAPAAVGPGPWARDGVTVVGTPPGEAGEPLRRAAAAGLPGDARAVYADTADEAIVYREYPRVPLAALPQFGHAWEAAYQAAAEAFQCSPHARQDVARWLGPDE
jgi:hypothetical protein